MPETSSGPILLHINLLDRGWLDGELDPRKHRNGYPLNYTNID
jgi:hypothetical protein